MNPDTKRLGHNTFILYIRAIIVMVISFWSSRLVLQALGVSDYGVYSVVGGVVATLSVVTGSLSRGISRFITVAMGRQDMEGVGKLFRTSIWMTVGMCLLVVLVAETAGEWFLNTKLNIPKESMAAANIVFQFSLGAFVLNLLSQPYDALLTSHEKFNVVAGISVFGSLFNLIIAYSLFLVPERLAWYGGLVAFNQLVQRIAYGVYCTRNFPECKYYGKVDWRQGKEMLSYSGCSLYLTLTDCLANQGVNMILNIYCGVVVNTARGITQQVCASVLNLSSSFSTALAPQLTKSYSADEKERTLSLLYTGTRYSYYLLFILLVPLFIELPFLFNIWLVDVPLHLVNFTRLSFIYLLLNMLTTPLWYLQMATGKVARYGIVIGTISLFNMPLSWGCLYCGFPPESVYIVWITLMIVMVFVRVILIKKCLPWFSFKAYFRNALRQIMLVSFLTILSEILINGFFRSSFFSSLVHMSCMGCMVAMTIYCFGLSRLERASIQSLIRQYVQQFTNK